MTDVIAHSTQHMTPEDAVDTAKYLKSIVDPGGTQARFVYDQATDAGLRSGTDQARGARVYLDNCAASTSDGKG